MLHPGTTDSDAASFDAAAVVVGASSNSPEPDSSRHSTESRSETREDSLGSSVSWMLILTSVQKALGFVRSIVVCRLLDPVNLGLMGMSIAFVDTALPICLLSIPAVFGRYLEKFRREKQSRAFVRQSAVLCGTLLLAGICAIAYFRHTVAEYVFGGQQQTYLVWLAIAALLPAGVFAFGTEMLIAFRFSRIASSGQFVRGISLTGLAILLLTLFQPTVVSVIVATIVSFVIGCVFVMPRLWTAIRDLPHDEIALPLSQAWRQLAPVIFWYWMTDFMHNMFFTVDRYMLLNLSPLSQEEALATVGNYESAHVLPLLIASVTIMVARIQLPYHSARWEAGDRQGVSDATNLTIKLGTLSLFLVGFIFVLSGNIAFDVLFRGQYVDGLRVLPMMCCFYCYGGISMFVLNHLWCAERAALGTVATATAIATNVVINFLLVPQYGVMGAAIATLIAGLVQLVILTLIAGWNDLRLQASTLAICLLPISLAMTVPVMIVGLLVVAGAVASGWLFTKAESEWLRSTIQSAAERLTHSVGHDD